MHQANLNYVQVNKYLKCLLRSGLVELTGDSYYLITRKGHEFLQLHNAYIERCNRIRTAVRETEQGRLTLERICFNGDHGIEGLAINKDILADLQNKRP